MVSMTSTLLSTMGSRVVLPGTGVLLNNGIMWFDPRPGQANSIGPGKRPLTNMCPVILRDAEGRPTLAAGASGGRKIMAAVFQLASFVADFAMSPQDAGHQPRIDVSGTGARHRRRPPVARNAGRTGGRRTGRAGHPSQLSGQFRQSQRDRAARGRHAHRG